MNNFRIQVTVNLWGLLNANRDNPLSQPGRAVNSSATLEGLQRPPFDLRRVSNWMKRLSIDRLRDRFIFINLWAALARSACNPFNMRT